MRRAEHLGSGPNGLPLFRVRFTQPLDQLSCVDHPPTPPGTEPLDDVGLGWESAWIDLGGEG